MATGVNACVLTTVRQHQSGQQLASSSVLGAAQLLVVGLFSQPQFDPHVLTGAVQRVPRQDPAQTHLNIRPGRSMSQLEQRFFIRGRLLDWSWRY